MCYCTVNSVLQLSVSILVSVTYCILTKKQKLLNMIKNKICYKFRDILVA